MPGRLKNFAAPTATFAAAGAIVAGLAAINPAAAGALTETASVPVSRMDWSTTAKIKQFDPSLGTLQNIGFGLTGTLHGTIGVENLEPTPSTVYGNLSSTIALSAPGAGQVLSVSPSAGASANLAAADGKIDFAGKSGRTFSVSNSQSATTSFAAGGGGPQLPVAPFVGTGKVALPVTASATSGISGPLDLAARTRSAAGAKVSVTYGTGKAAPPAGGYGTFGSSSAFMTAAGFGIELLGTQQTPTQTQTLSDQGGNWTRDVSFDPFDPALGTLESANLTISGDVKAKLSVQNTGRTAGSYNVDQSVAFSLIGPGGKSLASTTADATRSGSLDPFAGIDDFSGPFGTTIDGTILGSSGLISDGYAPDLDFFSGPDPLTLAIEAIGSLSAELPGSADLWSSALEGAEISLSYTYLPAGISPTYSGFGFAAIAPDNDPVPEPGSFAVLVSALAGLGFLRPRRR
jgi:hypothetical protein